MSDIDALRARIDEIRDVVTRIDERQVSDRAGSGRLERRVARIEMAILVVLGGAAVAVWKIVALSAGVPL